MVRGFKVLFCIVALVAGCTIPTPPSGIIVGKEHQPFSASFIPVQQCDDKGDCVFVLKETDHKETWTLVLSSCQGSVCKTTSVSVDATEYNSKNINDVYP